MRITFKTPGNKLVDIVDLELEVEHEWYILFSDCKKIMTYAYSTGCEKMTPEMANKLIEMKLLRENKVPF